MRQDAWDAPAEFRVRERIVQPVEQLSRNAIGDGRERLVRRPWEVVRTEKVDDLRNSDRGQRVGILQRRPDARRLIRPQIGESCHDGIQHHGGGWTRCAGAGLCHAGHHRHAGTAVGQRDADRLPDRDHGQLLRIHDLGAARRGGEEGLQGAALLLPRDGVRGQCSRLLTIVDLPATEAAFAEAFDGQAVVASHEMVDQATQQTDPAIALDVINASSGRSNSSQNLFPQRVLTRAFPRTFRLALLDKDVGICARMLREQKVPAPAIQLTAELMSMAHRELGEEADHVEAVKVIERMAGEVID